MGFFRDIYETLIREGWLVVTGRTRHLYTRAELDVRIERKKARRRPKYEVYVAEIETWKASFEALMVKMEKEEGLLPADPFEGGDFVKLPEVPDISEPFEHLFDHDVALQLQEETQAWRRDRIARVEERLGIPGKPRDRR